MNNLVNNNVNITQAFRLLIAVTFLLAGCATKAPVDSGLPPAADAMPVQNIPGYLTSPRGEPLRDARGRCWRTADWRPALAIEACDAALARERKLRELAVRLSGVATVPGPEAAWEPQSLAAVAAAPEQTRVDGAPPTAAAADAADPAGATAEPAMAATAVVPGSALPAPAGAANAGNPAAEEATAAAPAAARADPAYIVKPVVLNTDAAFFFGKDRLTAAGKEAVENLAAYFRMWGIEDVQVEVIGHSDRIGNPRDNVLLSKRRAEAVRQVLMDAGIPARSISAIGVGSARPVTSADTCPDDIDRCERINCLAPDRRVEVGLKGVRKAPAD